MPKQKALRRLSIASLLLFTALALSSFTSLARAENDADALLSRIIDRQRGGTMRATMTMTVLRPNSQNEFQIDIVGDGEERSLIRVLAPARDAGQAFLTDADNLFLYNPRLRRTLRIPPSGRSDSFLNSDISYNDIGGRDMEEDYSAHISHSDAERIELTLTPSPLAPTPYGQVIVTARADDLTPLHYLFFDQRDTAVRRIDFFDYVDTQAQDDDGETLRFPTRMEISNLLREGEKTIVQFSDYQFGLSVPESCFEERALERGCL